MPLMSFSTPELVVMLRNGKKPQTTRVPRKNAIKEGDILYCYYRSRMAKSCKNCISMDCETSVLGDEEALSGHTCSMHTNFIGIATVIQILESVKFCEESQDFKETWAVLDGFANFEAADKWFTKNHGPGWQNMPLDVISFEGHWLKKPSAAVCGKCRKVTKIEYGPFRTTDIACTVKGLSIGSLDRCPLRMEA